MSDDTYFNYNGDRAAKFNDPYILEKIGREVYNSLRYGDTFIIDWSLLEGFKVYSLKKEKIKNGIYTFERYIRKSCRRCHIYAFCPGELKVRELEESFCISFKNGNVPLVMRRKIEAFIKEEDFLI
jgi:hypothetical protein